MNNNIFGKRLKLLRENANISIFRLAQELNISPSAISQYESGKRTPSDDIKILIAKFFNVSADYLLGLTPFPNNSHEEVLLTQMSNLTSEEIAEIQNFIDFLKSKHNK